MRLVVVPKLAVWVVLSWLLVSSLGCQSARVTSLQKILAPDTVGVLIEWGLPEDSLQLGSAGSGSSGWRLMNPAPLCPLIANALSAAPPECVKPANGAKDSPLSICDPTAPQLGGCKDTRPASACGWEGGSGACKIVPPIEIYAPPLRSSIVLTAPLDPVLERAFSHRILVVQSDPLLEDAKNRSKKKLSHIGLFFDQKLHEVENPVEPKSDDCEAAAFEDGWVLERVSRKLTGLGAHRQLVTKVVLTPRVGNVSRRGAVGSLALVEALPSGLYADKFEIQRMSSDGVASVASAFGPVDIERPAPECTQSLVVAYSRPVEMAGGELEASFVVPLHSRYPAVAFEEPRASTHLHHTTVELRLPIYVLWTESTGLVSEEQLRMHNRWQHAPWQEATRKGDGYRIVSGEDIAFNLEGRGEDVVVRWTVPHGRAEHAAIVRIGTISVSVLATACMVFLIVKKA